MRALGKPKFHIVRSVDIPEARKLTSSSLVNTAVPPPTRVAFRSRWASSVIAPHVIWYIWSDLLHWSFTEMICYSVRQLLIQGIPFSFWSHPSLNAGCGAIWQDNKEKEQKRNKNWKLKVCRKIASEQNFRNNEITEMYLNKQQQYGEWTGNYDRSSFIVCKYNLHVNIFFILIYLSLPQSLWHLIYDFFFKKNLNPVLYLECHLNFC